MAERIILGIDPGSRATGYGLVAASRGRLALIDAGVIRPETGLDLAGRLGQIYAGIKAVIQRHEPTESAVEEVFQAKNARSALILGHARGALLLAAVHGALPVYEYAPTEIKRAVVGYGRAEKAQVQHMVRLLLNLSRNPAQDAADALAVAICHAHASTRNRLIELDAAGRRP